MRYWIVRDFVSARGENLIAAWLRMLPIAARVEISTSITLLEQTERLDRPQVGLLRNECEGLLELRVKVNNVQYRPIGYYGPQQREITLLVGAVEKGRKFVPPTACSIAFSRIQLLKEGRASTCEHEL